MTITLQRRAAPGTIAPPAGQAGCRRTTGWALLLSASAHALVLSGVGQTLPDSAVPKPAEITVRLVPAAAPRAEPDPPPAQPPRAPRRTPRAARLPEPAPRTRAVATAASAIPAAAAPQPLPETVPESASAAPQPPAVHSAAPAATPALAPSAGGPEGVNTAVTAAVGAAQRQAVPAPPAPPPPWMPARVDADYLDNPRPAYPALSRRLGEEGRVLLRVQVGTDGRAVSVAVVASSGHPRLDRAAREAVGRWRFLPARRGDVAEASWALVPINFALN